MIFFHDRFKQLRLNLKWSQIDIAKECKVTRHAVRFWEKGEHIPSERYVRKLADILNISVSEISNLQDFRKTNNELNNNIKAFNNLLQTTFTERKTDHLAFIDVLNKKFIEQENIFIILKAIINSFDTAIYVKDVNNKYLLGNKAFIKMLNLDECYNLISKVDKDLLSIREATNNSIEDEEVLSGRLTINKDERAILGTKKKKSGLVSKKSIINNNNEIIGMVCSITDITIQRFKKKALFFLIEKIQSRFNIMYVVFDKKGKFVYTNRGLCYNIFGIPEDIPGEYLNDYFLENIVHPEDREAQAKYFPKQKKDGSEERIYRINHPKKGLRYLSSHSFDFMEVIVVYTEDITDKKVDKDE